MLVDTEKSVSDDVVIHYSCLKLASDHIRKQIAYNLDVSEKLHGKYPQSIMFMNFAYEETGRYYSYVKAYCNKKDIRRSEMKDLADHEYKLTIPLNDISTSMKKSKLTGFTNQKLNGSSTNSNKYESLLGDKKELFKWIRLLPNIKSLAIYPGWWKYKPSKPVDLQVLMHSKDITLFIHELNVRFNLYLNWAASFAWQSSEFIEERSVAYNLQLKAEKLFVTNMEKPGAFEKYQLVNDTINDLNIIYTAMRYNNYSRASRQTLAKFLKNKKIQGQFISDTSS